MYYTGPPFYHRASILSVLLNVCVVILLMYVFGLRDGSSSALASLKSHKSVNSLGVGTVTCSLVFWPTILLPANVL